MENQVRYWKPPEGTPEETRKPGEMKSYERPDWVAAQEACGRHNESWINADLSNEEREEMVRQQNLRIIKQREARGESYRLSPPLK